MIPTELIYLLAAVGLGVLVYRYFTGHGGLQVSKAALGDLPAHSMARVSFDLFIIRSWDGNNWADIWDLSVDGGATLHGRDAGREDRRSLSRL